MSDALLIKSYLEAAGEAQDIMELVQKIKHTFEDHFDRTWFSLIIDGLPIDFRTVRLIREVVSLHSLHPGDEWLLYQGAIELGRFVYHVRKFLLPVIKERLRVSGLFPHQIVKDKTQYILRRFVVYTFPHNLERLACLTGELKDRLLVSYPFLEPA